MHKLSLLIVIVLSGMLAMPSFAQNVFSASQAAAEKKLSHTVMSTEEYKSTVTRLQTQTKNALSTQMTAQHQPGPTAPSTATPAAAPVQQPPASDVNQYSSPGSQSVSAPASSMSADTPAGSSTGSAAGSPTPAPSQPYTGFGGSQSNTQTAPQSGGTKSSGGGWDFNY